MSLNYLHMKMFNKKSASLTILSASLFMLTPLLVSAAVWTPPTVAPPDGNVPAPVNVGSNDQNKLGGFSSSNFLASFSGIFTNQINLGSLTNNSYGRLYFNSGTSPIAGVINRGTASSDLYFGETSDSGEYVFRGSGPLQLLSASDANHAISLKNSYTGKTWNIYQLTSSYTPANGLDFEYCDTACYARMVIDQLGNVGIGTTNPLSKLYVKGGGWAGGLKLEGGTNGRYLQMGIEDVDAVIQTDPTNDAGLYLQYQSAGNVLLGYGGGKVGIGTANPVAKLDLGSSGEVRFPADSGSKTTHFNYSNGYNYIRGTTIIADTGGNVGIGTTDASQKLTVAGNIYLPGISTVFSGSHLYLRSGPSANLYLGSNDTNGRVTLNANGNFGIGADYPAQKLDVNGSVRIQGGSPANNKVLTATNISGDATWNNLYFCWDYRSRAGNVNDLDYWVDSTYGSCMVRFHSDAYGWPIVSLAQGTVTSTYGTPGSTDFGCYACSGINSSLFFSRGDDFNSVYMGKPDLGSHVRIRQCLKTSAGTCN